MTEKDRNNKENIIIKNNNMTIIYPTKDYYEDQPDKRPDSLAYDLEEEKALIAEATEEIKKELLAKWQQRYAGAEIFPPKVSSLNPELVQQLLNFSNTQVYDKIAQKNSLNQEQRDALPRVVWDLALESRMDNLGALIKSKLNISDEAVVGKITQELQVNILIKLENLFSRKTSFFGQKAEGPKNVSLPIAEALKKYPALADQLITGGAVKLTQFPAPARPSIKNWIADYRQKMGAYKHGIVERGKYIFESENMKKMPAADRQKVAFIMKSLDEDFPLLIDAANERVLFPETKKKEENISASGAAKGSVSFSSSHKLPIERSEVPRQTFGAQNARRGGNVVNLKD